MAKPINHSFFSTWGTEMTYVFGFWFADGHMTQPDKDCSVAFTTKDLAHLQLIQKVMRSKQNIYIRSDGFYRLTIGSKTMWHDLYSLGGRPAKSLMAKIPSIPQELRRHFIHGFVDGDGSLYWETVPRRKPMLKILGGVSFLEELAQIIEEETGVGIAMVRNYSYQTPFIAYPGIKAQVLAKWLYIPGDLALERKATIAREFSAWALSKYGWKSQAVMTPQMLRILGS